MSRDPDVDMQFALEASIAFGTEGGEDQDDVNERYGKFVQDKWREQGQATHRDIRDGPADGHSSRKSTGQTLEEWELGADEYDGALRWIEVTICVVAVVAVFFAWQRLWRAMTICGAVAVMSSVNYATRSKRNVRNGAKVVPVLIFHLLLLSSGAIVGFILVAKNDPHGTT
jgi:hypothetical protein